MSAQFHAAGGMRRGSPVLLNGVSWGGFGLIALLFGIWSMQWVLSPVRLIAIDGGADLLASWFSFWVAMLVGAASLFLAVIVVLNAAVRAGLDRAWVAVPAAVAGSLVAAGISSVVGSAPAGLDVAGSGPAWAMFWMDWAAAIAVGYLVLLRVRAAREAEHRIEHQRKGLETRQAEARLRVLQAQIEPHFLFNTLSNIRRLCQSDAAAGRAMLAQLARYLRGALPKIRRDQATLADELELVEAYLALQKIRMGERLRVAIDVPEAHLRASIPPMMLVTLVENAIKHGIAPLPEGGSIAIVALREGDALRITVADTGQGFAAASGNGLGLSNIRARLAALHGDRASLRLEANEPRGVRASITLPCVMREVAP
jgi:signal transduction histidine kinase